MPFEKVETQVDFPAQEREIQLFWDRTQAFEKLREKNHNGKPWAENYAIRTGSIARDCGSKSKLKKNSD
jgi:hypothetical protein